MLKQAYDFCYYNKVHGTLYHYPLSARSFLLTLVHRNLVYTLEAKEQRILKN